MEQKKITFSNARVQLLSGATLAMFQLLSVVILARLLSPVDFGLAAAASIVTNIALFISEFGLGAALVQRTELNDKLISTALLISLIMYGALGSLVYFVAELMATYNSSEELGRVIKLLIIPFVFTGLACIPKGLLLRDFQYKKLMFVNVFSYFVGMLIVPIILASYGFGVWSIVWGQIVLSVLTFSISLYYSKMKLAVSFGREYVGDLLRFGFGVTLVRLFDVLVCEGDKLILGHTMNISSLGIFERLSKISLMLSGHLGFFFDSLLFPSFSRLQSDHEKFKEAYLKSVDVAVVTGCLISAVTPLFSSEIILLILGEGWLDYTKVLMLLLVLPGVRLVTRVGDVAMRALSKLYLNSCIKIVAAILTLICIYYFSEFGLRLVAVTYIAVGLLIVVITHLAISFILQVGFSALILLMIKRILSVLVIIGPIWVLVLNCDFGFYGSLMVKLSYLLLVGVVVFIFEGFFGESFRQVLIPLKGRLLFRMKSGGTAS